MSSETAIVDDPKSQENTNEPAETAAIPEIDHEDLDLGYSVELDAFSGPLDLLLYLVRRSELDITDIKIADIADQFLKTLQAWDDMNLDVAGDFILMAASLLEIKARMVVPPDENLEDEEEDIIDPRAELIQQLLQFRKFKEATQVLQSLEDNNLLVHHRRYSEQIPDEETDDDYNLENADPYQLFVLWDNILVSIAGKRPRTVVYDDIPIEQRVKQVLATMRTAQEGQLDWLFSTVGTRIQRIGVFVAVLECVRKNYLEAIQHEQYRSVYLRYRDDAERTAKPTLPPIIEEDSDKKGKRRRRKRQLVTYRVPEDVLAEDEAAQDEATQEELDLIEEDEINIETDEQRFLRELNEATAVDDLLSIGKDLEASLQAHLYDQGVLEETLQTENDDELDELDDEEDEYDDDDDFDDEYDDDDDDDEFEDEASEAIDMQDDEIQGDQAEVLANEDNGLDVAATHNEVDVTDVDELDQADSDVEDDDEAGNEELLEEDTEYSDEEEDEEIDDEYDDDDEDEYDDDDEEIDDEYDDDDDEDEYDDDDEDEYDDDDEED